MKLIQHSKPTFYKGDAGLFKPILKSSQIACGEIAKNFEKRFSSYLGCTGAIATNSGTAALHLSLMALDIGKGDEVIIPSYVCASLLNAINYVDAKPVLADIDYDTFNISIKDTKRKLTKKTRAVIIPHMFGLPCDIDEFLKLNLPVIEDCAQSLGAKYRHKLTGSFGLISIFSFYATKLITTGYGGMVASNSKKLLDKMRDLNEMDKREDYKIRYNYKMSDLEAALGINQLQHIGYFIKKRKEISRAYTMGLSDYDLELPVKKDDRGHVFYRYVIKSKKAAVIKRHLRRNGIEIIPPVYKPLHRYLSLPKSDFPNTERVYRETVSLPVYPTLKIAENSRIIRILRQAIV
ncbi:MAG: DegT/DnrJ/EryC1/StrS family aminotransferase [Candidatus Omnitrophota bacterium]